jgi:transcription termination/antitermination protein NusG
MNYFIIQVRTRGEEKYMALARSALKDDVGRLLFPRKKMKIRRRGQWKTEIAPIFPGYVFWEAEELDVQVYWKLKRTGGYFRFVKARVSNIDIPPLAGHDRELILHFLGFGEVAERSKVIFDENDRIVVLAGPLKGLEGSIVKVDKRKGRAKLRLTLCEEKFLIDLGFEAIERITTESSDGKNPEK